MKGLREQLQASLSSESAAVLYADGVQIAINQKLIAENWRCDDFEIPPGAEVAFLPRVTGG
jgi:molybdopterin converting factor small subunit